MEPVRVPPRQRRWAASAVVLAAAVGCLGLGLLGMAAWWAHAEAVLSWPGDSPPVVFNVALSYAILGIGFAALLLGWRPVAIATGAFDAILALLVITEYVFDARLGIDELLHEAYIVQAGTVPGRMPLNTSVCFVLAGVGVAAAGWSRAAWSKAVDAYAGLAVAGIGVLAIVGQSTDTTWAYSWARTTSMAMESAIAVVLVGFALMALAAQRVSHLPEWAPLLVGATIFVTGTGTWFAFNQQADRRTDLTDPVVTRAGIALSVLVAGLVVFVAWLGWRAERGRTAAESEARRRADAEAAVRASEARLFQVLDAMPVGVVVVSPDQHPYYANSEAVRLLGTNVRPNGDGSPMATYPFSHRGGSSYPAADVALARASHGESDEFAELEVHLPDGAAVPVEVRSRPLFAADHSVEYALLAVDDMSRRKAAERSLAEQAALLDLAYDAIFVTDPDHVIRSWNHGAELTYGFAKREAIGQFAPRLLGTQYPIGLDQIDAELEAIGSWQGELVQTRRDRQRIVVASRWAIRRDAAGRRSGTLEVNRDITEETERLNSMRAVMSAAPDLLVVTDRNGRVTDCSDGAERLTGWPLQHIIGSHFGDYVANPEDALLAFRQAVVEGGVTEYPVTIRHRNGSTVEMLANAAVYTDSAGNLLGVVAAARDVTERRKAEQQIALHAARLEAANRELARSNADLEQFAYLASHDLAEPLRAISGPVSLLADRYRGRLDAETEEVLDFAVDGCQRMQLIIDGLLAFSRVGRVEGAVETTDAGVIAKEALAALAPVLHESHAEITIDPLPSVLADPEQLSQVFQNLVANAVKFVAPGVTPRVHICADPVASGWRISVIDNGIGVDPEFRLGIFGMFKRLHARGDYPGTGIGLALVKKIVERNGGEVGVDDAPAGTGSRFWFTLRQRGGQGS